MNVGSFRHYLYPAIMAAVVALSGYSHSQALDPRVMAPATAAEVDRRPDHVADRRPMDFSPELLRFRRNLAADLGTGQDVQFLGGVIEGSGDNFTWRGRIRDRDGLEGPATLTVLGSRVSGSFYLEGEHYVLSTNRNGQTWLDRLDPSVMPPAHPPGGPATEPVSFSALANRVDLGAAPAPAETDANEAPMGSESSDGAVLDIVMFYSRGAYEKRSEYSDEAALRLAIRNSVDRTNTALANSKVSARMRLVGLFPSDLTEADESVKDLHNLRSDEQANELRERYSADFASLVTANTDFCGWGWLSTFYTSDFSSPYTWVSANGACLNGATLAHELGHNMGLYHDDVASPRTDENGDPVPSVEPFAWGHFEKSEFLTVMAYHSSCGRNCRQLGQFSDPDINDPASGLPTGRPDLANNAEVLRRYAPDVEQWRTPPATVSQALGQSAGVFRSQGNAAWVAQDKQLRKEMPTMLSGPVFGDEATELIWHYEHIAPTSLNFATRAWAGTAAGELRIMADGERVQTIDGIGEDWRDITAAIPAGTKKITWEWSGNGIEDVAAVGQVLLADVNVIAESPAVSGQILNGRGEPVSAVTVTASADEEVTDVRGQGSTDDEGRFLFLADDEPTPVAYYQATGEGVETVVVSQAVTDCLGSDYPCAITLQGEARTVSGELFGADPGEPLELALRSTGSSAVMSITVTADDSGQAEFTFTGLDALYQWGPLSLVSSTYESAELADSLALRSGNVSGLTLELTLATSDGDTGGTDSEGTNSDATNSEGTNSEGTDSNPPNTFFSGCSATTTSTGFDPVLPLLMMGGLLGLFRRPAQKLRCTLNEPA